ncbi:putative choline transporter, neither null mutation nor overexpression affects choline transport [Quaeritorhiza haematococci]|nr:putative choline transporter, neither null mutation nor overexpression affects choline transport [Quaeritorhiza haematococci]
MPISQRADLQPIVREVYAQCISYLVGGAPDAVSRCFRYTYEKIITNVPAVGQAFENCVNPYVNGNKQSTNMCADWALNTLEDAAAAAGGGAGRTATTARNLFTQCSQGFQNGGSVDTVKTCVRSGLASAGIQNSSSIDNAINKCVEPALNQTTSSAPADSQKQPAIGDTISGCLNMGLSQLALPDVVERAYTRCVAPALNGSATLDDTAAFCARSVLEEALGADGAFQLIVSAMTQNLGEKISAVFNDQCIRKTVGDLVSGTGIDLRNCLLQGLASKFCKDLQAVGPELLKRYFNSFRDRVAQNAGDLARTLVTMVAFGIGMAFLWMSVMSYFAEGLIMFGIVMTLLQLTVLSIINFIIANIVGGIILLVYLVIKMGWYCWTWRQIKFAAALLRTSLKYLKRNPQPFFLAVFVFLWMGGWCIVFAAAYLNIYRPNLIPDPTLLTFATIVLVLGFFWSFEVWKNILAVSISGAVATWYYFVPDRHALAAQASGAGGHGGEPPTSLSASSSSATLAARSSFNDSGAPKSTTTHTNPNADAQLRYPTLRSFAQSLTTSFGTICLGSLIVASLKTFHYLYKRAQNADNRPIIKTIVLTLLSCLTYILQTFNLYAFVRVGVFCEGYLEAARKTLDSVKSKGLEMLVNDDLVDGVLSGGRVLGGLSLGAVAAVVARWRFALDWDLVLLLTVFGLLFGFTILSIMAVVIEIAVATLFICFAEDPEALLVNHPKECRKFVKALRWRCKQRKWDLPRDVWEIGRKFDEGKSAGSGAGKGEEERDEEDGW